MYAYDQTRLLEKLNQYLEIKHRSLEMKSGYCHGISLLWLHCMSNNTELWFYSTIKKIIHANNEEDFDAFSQDIERFISYIEWLQHSSHYLPNVRQSDIDILLEKEQKYSLSFLMDENQFNYAIREIIANSTCILLSSQNHSIGIYRRQNHFYIFDPNNSSGLPVITDDLTIIGKEIVNSFYPHEIYLHSTVPLNISVIVDDEVMQSKLPDKEKLLRQFLNKNTHINDPSINLITNLYFATVHGDEEAVKELLENGADPNQISIDGWTPLMAAASLGYLSILQELLSCGANIKYQNKDGFNALSLAHFCHHDDIVKALKNYEHCPLSLLRRASLFNHSEITLRTVNDREHVDNTPVEKTRDAALLCTVQKS